MDINNRFIIRCSSVKDYYEAHVLSGTETIAELKERHRNVQHRLPRGFWEEVAALCTQSFGDQVFLTTAAARGYAQRKFKDTDWAAEWEDELQRLLRRAPASVRFPLGVTYGVYPVDLPLNCEYAMEVSHSL